MSNRSNDQTTHTAGDCLPAHRITEAASGKKVFVGQAGLFGADHTACELAAESIR